MSEKVDESVDLLTVESKYVRDRDLPDLLNDVASVLEQIEAVLAVEITGAESPSKPWANRELVTSLQSLVITGRAVEGVPLELVQDFLSLTYGSAGVPHDNHDFCGCLQSLHLALANYSQRGGEYFYTLTAQQHVLGQEALLSDTSGFVDEFAAKRLTKYATVAPEVVVGLYERSAAVELFKTGQAELGRCFALLESLQAFNEGKELQLKIVEEVSEKEIADFDTSELADIDVDETEDLDSTELLERIEVLSRTELLPAIVERNEYLQELESGFEEMDESIDELEAVLDRNDEIANLLIDGLGLDSGGELADPESEILLSAPDRIIPGSPEDLAAIEDVLDLESEYEYELILDPNEFGPVDSLEYADPVEREEYV